MSKKVSRVLAFFYSLVRKLVGTLNYLKLPPDLFGLGHMTNATPIWTPSAETIETANITKFIRWLDTERNVELADYHALWQWSVTEIEAFWQAIWDYFEVTASVTATTALTARQMPGADWFPGARLNYAENVFAKMIDGDTMIYTAEEGPTVTLTKADITQQVAALQATMRNLGVGMGDRVVAYLPNIPEAIIGCLAAVGLGAIWSSASPDFGARSVLDRFGQIEPKLLLAVDGYMYNGRNFDRTDVVTQIQQELPTLEHTIVIPLVAADLSVLPKANQTWQSAVLDQAPGGALYFEQVPFDHPLWVLYSSGTTGLPKPIVHGHGGNLLEHLKSTAFHNDLKEGERFFWYTSTGWMMWNYLIGSLLAGCSIALFNGSPGYPNLERLWHFVAENDVNYFGLSPAFVGACAKAGLVPKALVDLSKLRGIGSTGAPLPETGFAWIYENVSADVALESLSGGTDLCTAFVGGARTLPIYAGEIQGASLGANVQAFDPSGAPIQDEVGELVITEPMPSMPIYFWNDKDNARYQASYFEMYPNIWRHGDWIKFNEHGGCVIYGRSDSTINRKGVRMGTSEIYQCVDGIDAVLDSLVIDLEALGRESYMPLFVVLREGVQLNEALRQTINRKLRQEVSPRHVPDDIYQVAEIPYTLSGKKLEVPVRRILLGQDVNKVANLGAMRNPQAVDFFVELAQTLQA